MSDFNKMRIESYWFGYVVVDASTGEAISMAFKTEESAQDWMLLVEKQEVNWL